MNCVKHESIIKSIGQFFKITFIWIVLCVVLLLNSGCGGGSATQSLNNRCIETSKSGCLSSSTYVQHKDSIAKSISEDPYFDNQWGLEATNAHHAWANISLTQGSGTVPGAGVDIGLLDMGVNLSHPLLSGQNITLDTTFTNGESREDGTTPGHGTGVTSLIASKPQRITIQNVEGFPGIAHGANLTMFSFRFPSNEYPTKLETMKQFDPVFSSQIDDVLEKNFDILNMSWGFFGLIESYSETALRNNLTESIKSMAQSEKSKKSIFVWAAGNAHNTDCEDTVPNCGPDNKLNASSAFLLAGLPTYIEELRGHYIAVVGIAPDGEIADFSNRCGIAQNWCIAAPADDITAAYYGPNRSDQQGPPELTIIEGQFGTSFAAPMTVGGLALIQQMFRNQLTHEELVNRLFATANKKGIYADSDIYGQGLMDLEAATSPVGTPQLFGLTAGSASGFSVFDTTIRLSPIFGNGFANSLAGQEITAFDNLGAPFWYKVTDFVTEIPRVSMLANVPNFMHQAFDRGVVSSDDLNNHANFTSLKSSDQQYDGQEIMFGFVDNRGLPTVNHLGLAQDAVTMSFANKNNVSVTAFATTDTFDAAPMYGTSLSWQPTKKVPITVHSGIISEQETVLGADSSGAFGTITGDTVYTGISTAFNLQDWKISANAEFGHVSPKLSDGAIINEMSSLKTSTYSIWGSRELPNGSVFSVGLSEPLRVEEGTANLLVPIGRTIDGEIINSVLQADMAPTDRQHDLSLQWRSSLAQSHKNNLLLEAKWIENPGHNERAGSDHQIFAGWQTNF